MSNPKFTQEEIKALKADFPISEYEVREGNTSKNGNKRRWFLYIRRRAIQERLDSLFGLEWETKLENTIIDNSVATATRSITIRGVYKDYTGAAKSKGNNDENLVKSADTDAFKRAASMWGIGLNIQDAPSVWTDNDYQGNWNLKEQREQEALNKFKQWLSGNGNNNHTQQRQSQAQQDASNAPTNANTENSPLGVQSRYVNKITVMETQNGKTYYKMDIGNNQWFSVWERAEFRNAGYSECETWVAIGEVYTPSLPIPVKIKKDNKGYWVLQSVQPSKVTAMPDSATGKA